MLACSVLHGLLHLAGFEQYAWISDFLLAVCTFYLSYVWGFARSFSVRLLAVLHIAFAWLGWAMLLFSLQSFCYGQPTRASVTGLDWHLCICW